MMGDGNSMGRALNVVLAPGSPAHKSVAPPAPPAGSGALAAGFQPQPSWKLVNFGGPTIAQLTFVNRYAGGSGAWSAGDMTNIDQALSKAMSDADLQSVMAQYYTTEITSTMLPSAVHDAPVPATVFKDVVEAMVQQLHGEGALVSADPAKTGSNIM